MDPKDADLIRGLQEAAGFSEHRLDQLDEALRTLADRIDLLTQRLGRVEQQLESRSSEGATEEQDLIDQMPPHAARAPYDRPERPIDDQTDQP